MTITNVIISFDTDQWTGESSRAYYESVGKEDTVVICSLNNQLRERFISHDVQCIACGLGQFWGSLNLSRILRNLPGDSINIRIYRQAKEQLVRNAIALVANKREISIEYSSDLPSLPKVTVEHPASSNPPAFMWIGNITPDCRLYDLINYLKDFVDKSWTLRVLGEGKASIVSPILKMCKRHNLTDKVEWIGYSSNPFEQMNGITHGIDLRADICNSIVSKEFAAASIPVITELTKIRDIL